ncbi:MAG TPA: hypothetical protein VJZ98_09410, partial [Actinomycetota bacterium]|nr:hypothetical protein [Actinomycetota bacterium]
DSRTDLVVESYPRCASSFAIFEEDRRTRGGDGDNLERVIPRPSPVREGLMAELQDRPAGQAPPKLRPRAERLYSWLTRTDDVGPS